jgi:hypothetical protein
MCGTEAGAEDGDARDVLSAVNPTSDRDNFHRGGKMNVLDRFVDPTSDGTDGDLLCEANALPWLVLANDTSWSSKLVGGKASLFDDGVTKERGTISWDGIASEKRAGSWSGGAIEGKKRSWQVVTSVKVANAIPAGLGWRERVGRRTEVGVGWSTKRVGQTRGWPCLSPGKD